MTDRTTSDTAQADQGSYTLPNGQKIINWEYYAYLGRKMQIEYIEAIQAQTKAHEATPNER